MNARNENELAGQRPIARGDSMALAPVERPSPAFGVSFLILGTIFVLNLGTVVQAVLDLVN